MTRASAARKLAAAAAYGGGGLSVLGGSLYALLRAEELIARRAIGDADNRVPDSTGWYGRGRPGPAIKIALLGDSSAAGYGVDTVEQTPGARLGAGVAAAANRRVHVREFAVVGAQSSALAQQIALALPTGPDVAVILVGANDVTHAVRPSTSVRRLAEAVASLKEAGVAVVVGTCPDLGTVRPIPQPLRQVAKSWSRRLAAAQTIAAVEAGGRSVSLGSILGPEFDAAPAILFGPDRFHPSAAGYASLAAVLVPSVLAALDLAPDDEVHPEALRGEGILPVNYAAVEATKHPGTEVGGTELEGESRGVAGRWAMLMRRRRHAPTEAEAPEAHEDAEEPATDV
ncbi:MAG TPA: SGNH/GDSL hydrolase family protein [Marmoricola sp.]|nr:SGNH/GDSL hydrolase family protein [Marmoricola sp.]